MNCSTRKNGGAIYFYGNGSVSGCSFVNCSSNGDGGAIYLWNGGSVNYCIFDNNKADYGSAIYIKGGSVDVDYNFFAFQNNVAEFPSGLIEGSIPNNWVVLDVFESGDYYVVKFILNKGSELNESMPDYNASLTINYFNPEEISIINNTFVGDFVNSTYKVNSLNTGDLLAFSMFGGRPEISFSALNDFIANKTVVELPHDYKFCEGWDDEFIEGIVIKDNVVIEGNGFTIDGSNLGRAFKITGNNVTIKNLNFIKCSNSNNGGAIYFSSYSGSIEGNSFVNCVFIDNTANGYSGGGAIYFLSNSGSIEGNSFVNCTFINNTAINDYDDAIGGAIYFNSWLDSVDNNSFVNCTFIDNTANGDGGAIYLASYSGFYNDSFVNCTFINNTANYSGGAICFTSWSGSVEGNSFVNCVFINNTADNDDVYAYGGAISFNLDSNNNSFVNCTFINNNANYGGGAICFFSDSGSNNNSFVNCTF